MRDVRLHEPSPMPVCLSRIRFLTVDSSELRESSNSGLELNRRCPARISGAKRLRLPCRRFRTDEQILSIRLKTMICSPEPRTSVKIVFSIPRLRQMHSYQIDITSSALKRVRRARSLDSHFSTRSKALPSRSVLNHRSELLEGCQFSTNINLGL